MKIISKHKDFYDFMITDNDMRSDDLIYNRFPHVIMKSYDDLFIKKNTDGTILYASQEWRLVYNHYYNTTFHNYIFGIYPYVYSQPVICFTVPAVDMIDKKTMIIKPLDKNDIDLFITDKQNLKVFINEFVDEFAANYEYSVKAMYNNKEGLLKDCKSDLLYIVSNQFSHYYDKFMKTKLQKDYTWKVECKEVFNKINAPIFVKFEKELFNKDYLNQFEEYKQIYGFMPKRKSSFKKGLKIHYISNIVFSQLKVNILKYWFDELNQLQTYINIENFLASNKMEPIANPDNKTKIVNHGFDLKTSFRKM